MAPTLSDLVEELDSIRTAYGYGNKLPSRTSKWYEFAQVFDIGVRDLDNIALDLGYHTFRLLDKTSPKEALKEKGEAAFMKALRATSLIAYGMNNSPLMRKLKKVLR